MRTMSSSSRGGPPRKRTLLLGLSALLSSCGRTAIALASAKAPVFHHRGHRYRRWGSSSGGGGGGAAASQTQTAMTKLSTGTAFLSKVLLSSPPRGGGSAAATASTGAYKLGMSATPKEPDIDRSAVAQAPPGLGDAATDSSMFSEEEKKEESSDTLMFARDPAENRGPLKVLFLSADTGGGHRASAESLAKQFLVHFPGSQYDLLDIWTEHGVLPYRTLVNSYKHLSAHPRQWRVLFHLSNSRPWELAMDWHSTFMCERRIRRRMAQYDMDAIVSVHPAMNNAPLIASQKISKRLGRHIPFFTVVTDLGSAHCTWFQKNVDKLFVASERLRKLAKRRGRTPDENIVMSGLPIRHDFAVQAAALVDRTTETGRAYRAEKKAELGLDVDRPVVMVMGGGEGVGSLSNIVDELYSSLTKRGINATICVVCGRNEKLKEELAVRDWDKVLAGEHKVKKRRPIARLLSFVFHRARRSKKIQDSLDRAAEHEGEDHVPGNVRVVGLGFVTRVAEYMVAADVLVTKAGPGTIAEAAAVGLPVMLTSFLPGQEAGNVDFVLEAGFGDYCKDPVLIGNEVAAWLEDEDLLKEMSLAAQEAGHPHAAADIVLEIGSLTHTWMAMNDGGSGSPHVAKANMTALYAQ